MPPVLQDDVLDQKTPLLLRHIHRATGGIVVEAYGVVHHETCRDTRALANQRRFLLQNVDFLLKYFLPVPTHQEMGPGGFASHAPASSRWETSGYGNTCGLCSRIYQPFVPINTVAYLLTYS